MLKAPISPDECQRLAALQRLRILDTADEAAFDDLTKLAAAICRVPIAIVSLVDENRQWFKSCFGLEVRSTDRDVSFCGHAIHSDKILEINDARIDRRFADNPLVTGFPHVTFYAGAPLIAANGERLGTLCVIDSKPKSLTEDQRLTLETLARQVVRLMEARLSSLQSQASADGLAKIGTFLDRILDSLPNLVAVLDKDVRYQYINATYQKWFGLSPETTIGRSLVEVFGAPVFEAVKDHVMRVLSGEEVHFETEAPYRLGGTRTISLHYQPLRNPAGEVEGFLAIINDVTQLRANAKLAQAANERLRNTFENAPVGLIELNDTLTITSANPAFCQMLEYDEEELIGQSIYRITHPDDVEKSAGIPPAAIAAAASRDSARRIAKRYLTKSGRVVLAAVTSRAKPGGPDRARQYYSCVEDISKLREAEAAAAIAAETLRHVVDAVPLFLSYLNNDGSYKFTNILYDKFYGERMALIRAGKLAALFSEADATTLASARSEALAGKMAKATVTAVGPQRQPCSLEIRHIPHLNGRGAVMGIVEVGEDITERLANQKRIDEQNISLAKSSKMVALGEMAAGVAHEINNPLAIIVGKSNHTRRMVAGEIPSDQSQLVANLVLIESTGHRIAKIVKGLRAFSRDSSRDDMKQEQVQELVGDALGLCQERFRNHGVELRHRVEGSLAVKCRAAQMVQVMTNLLGNAFDAVLGTDRPWVEITAKPVGDKVVIAVTDSGCGIPESVVDKMMQPFFTTKPVDKGTGLGLSISLGIAKEHGGDLFYDKSSANTRFVLDLPALPAKAEGRVAS